MSARLQSLSILRCIYLASIIIICLLTIITIIINHHLHRHHASESQSNSQLTYFIILYNHNNNHRHRNISTVIMIISSSLSQSSQQSSYNNQYNAMAVVAAITFLITVYGQSHNHMLRFLKHDYIYRNRHVYFSGREYNPHLYSDINTKHILCSRSEWNIRGAKKNRGTFLNFHHHHQHADNDSRYSRISTAFSAL